MGKLCKKCGHERQDDEIAPEYACPKCGAVYAKVEARLKSDSEALLRQRGKEEIDNTKVNQSPEFNNLECGTGITFGIGHFLNMSKGFWISLSIFLSAGFGAYWEQIHYDPRAEARTNSEINEAMYRSIATEAVADQQRCLQGNPADWCNRDISFQDNVSIARSIGNEQHIRIANDLEARNRYLFIAIVSGLIAFFSARNRLRSRKEQQQRPSSIVEP